MTMQKYLNRVAVAAVTVLAGACANPTAIVVEPLRVINWSPASGAFCIGVDTTVAATFSDDIDPASLTAATFHLNDASGPVAATLDYDKASFTAKLTPSAKLTFDQLYTIVAGSGLRGTAEGRLAIDLDASFMTVERTGCTPGVECSRPSDCPGTQICANIGVCIDECVTDKDCYRGTCQTGGTCVPNSPADGGGGDP
jgi:hypothetical protein